MHRQTESGLPHDCQGSHIQGYPGPLLQLGSLYLLPTTHYISRTVAGLHNNCTTQYISNTHMYTHMYILISATLQGTFVLSTDYSR